MLELFTAADGVALEAYATAGWCGIPSCNGTGAEVPLQRQRRFGNSYWIACRVVRPFIDMILFLKFYDFQNSNYNTLPVG